VKKMRSTHIGIKARQMIGGSGVKGRGHKIIRDDSFGLPPKRLKTPKTLITIRKTKYWVGRFKGQRPHIFAFEKGKKRRSITDPEERKKVLAAFEKKRKKS